ncbi:MAG: M1 family metallopeptidase, partial [Candidatus Aminicenantales bacterium]
FCDGSGKELSSAGPAASGDESELTSIFHRILKKAEKSLRSDLRLKLLPDLLEDTPAVQGLFLACFDCANLPPAIAVFAPDGLNRAWFGQDNGAETTALYVMHEERGGCWYSERPLTAPEPLRAPGTPALDALRYTIDTTIRKNTDIEGRTTLRFRSNGAGVRVIPLDLFAKLRLSSVRLKKGDTPAAGVPFIQGDDESNDPVLVVLPGPLASGEEAEITAEYQGEDVLHDAGENNYSIGARQNWYPVLNGFGSWAVYDLTYRIPKKRQIVSVGKLVESTADGDFVVSRYTSGQPVRAAGFNYGVFQLIEKADPDSGVKIRVYTNPGEPDFARQLRAILPTVNFDTVSMAEDTLADSINTARVGTLYFGPLPQNDIAVTQQTQWNFGQSWPTLIYIPYMAFLDWVTRMELGLYGATSFVEQVTPHEFAHQWWGHRVGSATYRDTWLSEGLAEFTVSLVVERAQGASEFRKYWDRARTTILDKPLHSVCANWEVGPISLGPRLMAVETPQAYGAIVYRKGAFVIHMLRSLFWDSKNPNRDHRFIEMMKDYIETWAGRNPTTRDFQTVVERHAPPPFAGNMGWFFRQWVDGTALPKIDSSLRVEDAGTGRFRVRGEVVQSGVPDDFLSVIPLYFEFDKNRLVRFAQVTVTGNRSLPVQGEMPLPKKPLRIVVNPNFELLTGR